jgi:hypothetical protein
MIWRMAECSQRLALRGRLPILFKCLVMSVNALARGQEHKVSWNQIGAVDFPLAPIAQHMSPRGDQLHECSRGELRPPPR